MLFDLGVDGSHVIGLTFLRGYFGILADGVLSAPLDLLHDAIIQLLDIIRLSYGLSLVLELELLLVDLELLPEDLGGLPILGLLLQQLLLLDL